MEPIFARTVWVAWRLESLLGFMATMWFSWIQIISCRNLFKQHVVTTLDAKVFVVDPEVISRGFFPRLFPAVISHGYFPRLLTVPS